MTLTIIKITLRLCALLIVLVISLALHSLLPGHTLLISWLDFIGLGMALMFAMTLVVSSFLVNSSASRSKLGQRLADKVSKQTGGSRELYERFRTESRRGTQGSAEAAMPAPHTKRKD